MFIGLAFVEIHMMYDALVRGEAPLQLPEAGSYAEYCIAQRQYTADLTTDSDEVRGWIDFLELNGGTLPGFSLPLGDASVTHSGDVITLQLLDQDQTDKFEKACTAAGARFSGGVFACGALAHAALTGEDTYSVITPTTTRRTQLDFMTTAGSPAWCRSRSRWTSPRSGGIPRWRHRHRSTAGWIWRTSRSNASWNWLSKKGGSRGGFVRRIPVPRCCRSSMSACCCRASSSTSRAWAAGSTVIPGPRTRSACG